MKKLLIILFFLLSANMLFAQTDSSGKESPESSAVVKPKPKNTTVVTVRRPDTLKPQKDTLRNFVKGDSVKIKDSIAKMIVLSDSLKQDSLKKAAALKQFRQDTSTYEILLDFPGLPFHKRPVYMLMPLKPWESKDELFYLIAGLLIYLAIIKLAFPKYFTNLFRLSFQTSFRQRQTRDQLAQDDLASFLMNMLFYFSAGIYIGLIAKNEGFIPFSYWWVMVYCAGLLFCIYGVKFLFMRFSGWVFNEKEASRTYTFLVFMVNKIASIILIPFLLLIAFSSKILVDISITISFILLIILLFYRFIVGLGTIRGDLKVNPFHFFLYLCAVEILPLLLLYKALFNYIGDYL